MVNVKNNKKMRLQMLKKKTSYDFINLLNTEDLHIVSNTQTKNIHTVSFVCYLYQFHDRFTLTLDETIIDFSQYQKV